MIILLPISGLSRCQTQATNFSELFYLVAIISMKKGGQGCFLLQHQASHMFNFCWDFRISERNEKPLISFKTTVLV